MKQIITIFLLGLGVYAQAQVLFNQRRNQDPALSINYSSPKEYEIADIEIKGVQFLDNNALISLSGLRVGDNIKIPGDGISSAIKKLWKQGIIGNISIYANKVEGDQVWLTIELAERPRLTDYVIEGVNKTQAGEIKDKIDLVKGRILTDVVEKNTELAVKRYMESKGYLNAEVNIVRQSDTILNNSAKIKIIIDRNEKVKVKNITFYGDTLFTSARLRSKLKNTGEVPRFSLPKDLLAKTLTLLNPVNLAYFLTHRDEDPPKNALSEYLGEQMKVNVFKSAKYIESDFEEDKTTLISFYNSKGFRDAEIIDDSIYSLDRKYMNIDMKMSPGKKYYFGDITWSGNYIYTDEQLDRVLGISRGDVYDLDLVNKKLNFNPAGDDVSSLYMDDGYLFFTVNAIETGINEDSVNLEMRIYEGVQATIDKVIVSGNDKTNDHVIYRELRTLPGQKFSRSDLIRTQRDLSQLGYFDPEQINPVPMPNPVTETVDIEWKLVERANDNVELSGGWGGFYGFVGTLGVSFNNFSMKNIPHFDKWRPLPMGDGQRLSIRMQANGRRYQSYNISFSEPWLGGRRRNTFGVNLNHSVQRGIGLDNVVYNSLKVSGVTLSLGRQVRWPDDYFTVSNSLSFLQYNILGFESVIPNVQLDVSNSIIFNTTISRNSIDNPMFPRYGSTLSLSVSATPPYSTWNGVNYEGLLDSEKYKFLEYHKWNFDANYYVKLIGDLVFAPRAHFGYIGSYTNRIDVGPFERFQLGGSGLNGTNFNLLGWDIIGLRGYEDNTITPRPSNGLQGGTIFTKYVMEMRYPVSLNPSATIYFLGFYEAGNNVIDFKNFNPFDAYRSAGVGVRIFMPAFGLLGLDWAYGFDEAYGSNQISGSQFHFSLGQQIR